MNVALKKYNTSDISWMLKMVEDEWRGCLPTWAMCWVHLWLRKIGRCNDVQICVHRTVVDLSGGVALKMNNV